MAYEVLRDIPMHEIESRHRWRRTTGRVIDGKKLVFVSILRAGTGILDGMLTVVPGARVGHIGLYRDPKTLVRRRVLLQDARRSARARRRGGRPDAGHRQLGRRGGGAAQGVRPQVDQVRLPADVPRGHRRAARAPIPTCRSTPPPSTANSTSTATSCRASATRATASSAPSSAGYLSGRPVMALAMTRR